MSTHDQSEPCATQPAPARKTWVTPQLQDQSVKSITEGGLKTILSTEFNASNGPSS